MVLLPETVVVVVVMEAMVVVVVVVVVRNRANTQEKQIAQLIAFIFYTVSTVTKSTYA